MEYIGYILGIIGLYFLLTNCKDYIKSQPNKWYGALIVIMFFSVITIGGYCINILLF